MFTAYLNWEKTVPNGRVDYTDNLAAIDRRFDTLSRLLSIKSKHIGTCIINEKLYIASVDLNNKSSGEDPVILSIQEIIQYFIEVARGKKNNKNEIFKKICSKERLKRELTLIETSQWDSVPDEVFEKVIENVLQHKDPKISELANLYGKHAAIAGILHDKCQHLLRDLDKVEETLNSKKSQNRLFNKVCSLGKFEILKEEPNENVHPGLQILSTIVKLLQEAKLKKAEQASESYIYIGLSFLNCFECYSLLKSANEIFQEKNLGVSIKTRGYGVDYQSWQSSRRPAAFSDNSENFNSEGNSLAKSIYFKNKQYIEELEHQPAVNLEERTANKRQKTYK